LKILNQLVLKKTILFFVLLLVILSACNNNESKEQENNDTIIEQIEETNSKSEAVISNKAKEIVDPELKPVMKQESEEIVFSFNTKSGKTMNILLHKDEKYLVYRFGTKDNLLGRLFTTTTYFDVVFGYFCFKKAKV